MRAASAERTLLIPPATLSRHEGASSSAWREGLSLARKSLNLFTTSILSLKRATVRKKNGEPVCPTASEMFAREFAS
jgi:hypothetical protein